MSHHLLIYSAPSFPILDYNISRLLMTSTKTFIIPPLCIMVIPRDISSKAVIVWFVPHPLFFYWQNASRCKYWLWNATLPFKYKCPHNLVAMLWQPHVYSTVMHNQTAFLWQKKFTLSENDHWTRSFKLLRSLILWRNIPLSYFWNSFRWSMKMTVI